MLIQRDQTIAGRPAVQIRGWMRDLQREAWSLAAFAEQHELTSSDAEHAMGELVALGLVRGAEGGGTFRIGATEDLGELPTLYTTTISGNALAKARIGTPMPRSKAQELLEELIARVESVNDSDEWLHWVTEVQLYGSLARPETEQVGDVDVAVRLQQRHEHDDFLRRQWRMIEIDGAQPGSIVAQIGYAQTKVLRYVRGKSPRVDLVPLSDRQPLPDGATAVVAYRRPIESSAPEPVGVEVRENPANEG
jgi:predicted nucleotidyltransferase